jgi:hypothetical protein
MQKGAGAAGGASLEMTGELGLLMDAVLNLQQKAAICIASSAGGLYIPQRIGLCMANPAHPAMVEALENFFHAADRAAKEVSYLLFFFFFFLLKILNILTHVFSFSPHS